MIDDGINNQILRYFPWMESATITPVTTITGVRVGWFQKVFRRKIFPLSGGVKYQYATVLDLLRPEASGDIDTKHNFVWEN